MSCVCVSHNACISTVHQGQGRSRYSHKPNVMREWKYVYVFDQENANGQQFGRQAIERLASKDPSRKKIVAVWSTEKRLSEMSRTSQLEKMKPREWAKRHEVSQPAGHGGWLSRQRHQHGQAAGCMCVQQLAAEIASNLSGLQGSSSHCVFLSVVGCQLLRS